LALNKISGIIDRTSIRGSDSDSEKMVSSEEKSSTLNTMLTLTKKVKIAHKRQSSKNDKMEKQKKEKPCIRI
jgi:hypothetical protein